MTRNFSRIFLSALVAAAFAFSFVLPANAQSVQSKTARSGKRTYMDQHFAWNNNCKPIIPEIDVVQNPANGRVSPKVAPGRIPSNADIGNSRGCAGKPLKGINVYYQSKPGYKGRDFFRIRVRTPTGSAFYTYNVRVF